MRQPTFFEEGGGKNGRDAARILLYALGEFQERGLVLAGRDLPLDRLRGAFRRAAEAFGEQELGDEEAAAALTSLGASVKRVPAFVAKHPFRVVVPEPLAERARAFFIETKKRD
ncbi:MAG TPA: hypothetical protein VJ866_21090 [Pyrinomonadaceae bacterium]|nr:hypothetical protein [Pyrinomonadaceae bacterium]